MPNGAAGGGLEFGLRRGLAVDLGSEQRIRDSRFRQQVKRQARIQQENKAKMFADDFEFTNAMNEHDNPLVKDFAQAKIKEIGKFINDNKDWETNVNKRSQYNLLIRELKDNSDLNRGMQSDTNRKAMMEYMADGENADLVNSPEFRSVQSEWQNYLKFGNQHGEEFAATEGKQPFVFTPPEEAVDYTKYLIQIAKSARKSEIKRGGGFVRVGVAGKDRVNAATLAMSHPMFRFLKKDYDKRGGDEVFGSVEKFIMTEMDPFFQEDVSQDQLALLRARRAARGTQKATPTNWWKQDSRQAVSNPNQPVQISTGGVEELLMDKNGNFDLNGGFVINPNTGDTIPVSIPPTKRGSTANSKLMFSRGEKGSRGQLLASVTMSLPKDQFEASFGDAIDMGLIESSDDLVDFSDFGFLSSSEVNENAKGAFKLSVDDAGNEVVVFETWKPVDQTEATAAQYNLGVGGAREKTQSVLQPGQLIGVDEAGQQWVIDAAGNPIEPFNP